MRKVYIEQVGKRYRCRWRDRPGRGAKWVKSETVKDRTQAVIMRERILARIAAEAPPRVGASETLAELAHAWARARTAEGNHPAHTQNSLKRALSFFDRWGLVDVADLTTDVLGEIRAGKRVVIPPVSDPERTARRSRQIWSPRTGAIVRAILAWARDHRHAEVDQAILVALRPRVAQRTRKDLVSQDVVASWITRAAMISPDAHALVHCLLTYGWRPITAGRLQCGDIDLKQGLMHTVIKSRRGTRPHVHPLRQDTMALLRPLIEGRKKTDPLFADPRTGTAFAETGSRCVAQWWRDTLGALGGLSYDGKRYACTMILRHVRATEGIRVTGHAEPAQLDLYATVNDERAREIVETVPALPSPGHTVGTPDSTSVNEPSGEPLKWSG